MANYQNEMIQKLGISHQLLTSALEKLRLLDHRIKDFPKLNNIHHCVSTAISAVEDALHKTITTPNEAWEE